MNRMSRVLGLCGLVTLFGAATALAGGNPELGQLTRLHTQDQLRDGSCVDDCLQLAAIPDQIRLQTRDRLHDCDPAPDCLLSEDPSWTRNRWEVRNRHQHMGIPSPESLLYLGVHPLFGRF